MNLDIKAEDMEILKAEHMESYLRVMNIILLRLRREDQITIAELGKKKETK